MSTQSWIAKEIDLLLNEHEADESRSDEEILKDLKHFVHCSKELLEREPTTVEKLYQGWLKMLWIRSGMMGDFDFLKLERRIIELVESRPVKCSHRYEPNGYGYGFRNFKCCKCGKTKTERVECPDD